MANRRIQIIAALFFFFGMMSVFASEIPKPCGPKTKSVVMERSLIESLGATMDGPDLAVPELDKAGKVVGFRIHKTENGSRFDRMGLKSDDILEKFNGLRIDSSNRSMDVFNTLKAAKKVCLSIIRNGNSHLMLVKLGE